MTDRKKLFVKYINYNESYEEESKRPFTEIWADKFNKKYHKKLFWKNFYTYLLIPIFKKFNLRYLNHPWAIGIGSAIIGGVAVYYITK